MSHALTVRLGDICDIQIGRTPSRSESSYWGRGHPWLSIADMNQGKLLLSTKEEITSAAVSNCGGFLVPQGTLLMSFKLSLGKLGIAGRDMYTNEAIAALLIRDPSRVSRDYLFHALSSLDLSESSDRAVLGATLNKRKLLELSIPLPAFAQQERIATILDKADSLRRKRQEAIRLMDKFLRSVFNDMFGDPSSNQKNFELGTVRDLVASANYGTSEKASEEVGEYPILRMNNITYEGGWDFSSLKYVDLPPAAAHKYLARRGDLLFNRTNSKELVGKTAVYTRDEPMAIAGYLVRVRMNERGNPHYVSGYLNSLHGKRTLEARAKSIVGMANINAQEMQDIPLLLPPIELQDRYAGIVEAVHARLETHQAFLREAVALHSALSHKFFGPVNAEEPETC